MSEIRRLTEADVDAVSAVYANAYPRAVTRSAAGLEQARERSLESLTGPGQNMGLFRAGELLGMMKLYDFTMNFAGQSVPVGGVGGVAVAFLHKKERVAKAMIEYYLDHYHNQGTYLAALYPFRPDFYRRMGFGYGTRMHQYRVRPAGFPRGHSKSHLQLLGDDDLGRIHACYERAFQRQHGLFARSEADSGRFWRRPEQQMVGYVDETELRGYLQFSFQPNNQQNFLSNDLVIHELIYESPAVLAEFLTFLHSQLDQIERVIYSTQDPDFLHLLDDPRNHQDNLFPIIAHETNIQGAGMMYRVIDLPGLLTQLSDHDFGGQTVTLALDLADSFRPQNAGRYVLQFTNGRVQLLADTAAADITLQLDVATLSSLLVGAIGLPALLRLGLATLSDAAYAATAARLFAQPAAPVCLTPF